MARNGSQWLPMAPNDFHRVSLLPNHYPQSSCWKTLKEARRLKDETDVITTVDLNPKVNI